MNNKIFKNSFNREKRYFSDSLFPLLLTLETHSKEKERGGAVGVGTVMRRSGALGNLNYSQTYNIKSIKYEPYLCSFEELCKESKFRLKILK